MIENQYISFNENIWGYDFTCCKCGEKDSTEGEAPISAMDAMKEKGWTFAAEENKVLPICPACS